LGAFLSLWVPPGVLSLKVSHTITEAARIPHGGQIPGTGAECRLSHSLAVPYLRNL
jgi:hypothetical protein